MARTAITILAVAVLILHATMLLYIAERKFVTIDEAAHIGSGIAHWETGTFHLYRVNPPLARILAVLPTFVLNPQMPEGNWNDQPGFRHEWDVGIAFGRKNHENYLLILQLARVMGIVWSILGALLIWRWSTELYGQVAGIIGLVIWCFGPNVLGHASIVTPDIPAAVAGLYAVYSLWKYLREPSFINALIAGILLGIAQLTKFTNLILFVIWPVLALIFVWQRWRNGLEITSKRMLVLHTALIFSVTLFVINAGYGFVGTGVRLGKLPFVSEMFSGKLEQRNDEFNSTRIAIGNRFRGTILENIPLPVPADFVRGIDVQRRDFETKLYGLGSYLAGKWQNGGWWYYYLYAFAVKVPLGFVALLAIRIIVTLWRLTQYELENESFVWIPAIFMLVFVSSQTGFSHHLRYAFGVLPFACVAISGLGNATNWRSNWLRWIVLLCLTSAVASSSMRFPHSFAYFNELAGGPKNGHAHLLDSNIDWGQDLIELKQWLDERPELGMIGVATKSQFDPSFVGIRYTDVPTMPEAGAENPTTESRYLSGPHPGWYAVSVNAIRGWLGNSLIEARGSLANKYEYFRAFEPVERIGYSIYIYHITLEEANRVRRQLGLPELERSSSKEE